MVIQFKDRKKELKEMQDVLGSGKFELMILYGRRRIGKTELALKGTEKKKRVYYLAVGENNLERFYSACAAAFPEIAVIKPDWEALFGFLKDKAEVVIIDEFQNLIKENSSIVNLFQSIVDLTLKNSKMKLFLLGSSVSMITSMVLEESSPLYGRRTGSMCLKAISFFDLRLFFPRASMEELVELYSFADGIPFYLVKIDDEFWHWLEKELKSGKSFLKDEVDFLMKYEFEDASAYKLILEAIANGKTKLNEIKDFIKVKRTDLTPYIKNLIEVKMVERIVPITENEKSRRGRYYLGDFFLKFWFRHIYRNLSSIEEGIFNAGIIKKEYSEYLGEVFEHIARQYMVKEMHSALKFNKIGKWWHKGAEIDIVAFDEAGKKAIFAECKWKERVNAMELAKQLNEKTSMVEWNNEERKEIFVIFAKSFSKKIAEFESKKVFCIDLKSIRKAMN